MLYAASSSFAWDRGGLLTRNFMAALPEKFKTAPDLIIDSRVHMLMSGWWPCIPGFHHDDVPRDRSDGQPDYDNPGYKSEHAMILHGDCCPTRFALGEAKFPEVPILDKIYKKWHPLVVSYLRNGGLNEYRAEPDQVILFDWNTWHEGVQAHKFGFRLFIRASINTKRKLLDSIRKNANVYMENPTDGW